MDLTGGAYAPFDHGAVERHSCRRSSWCAGVPRRQPAPWPGSPRTPWGGQFRQHRCGSRRATARSSLGRPPTSKVNSRSPSVAPGTYAVVGEKDGFETATAVVTVSENEGASADLTLASTTALDVNVVAKRLEEARISIQPKIGASTYEFTRQAIESQPGGDNNTPQPGPPAGAGRHAGLERQRLHPRPQRARQRAVPHQRRGAAGRREPLRPERRTEPAPGERRSTSSPAPCPPSTASARPASWTCRPRAGPSSREQSRACTEAASPGSSRAPSTAAQLAG